MTFFNSKLLLIVVQRLYIVFRTFVSVFAFYKFLADLNNFDILEITPNLCKRLMYVNLKNEQDHYSIKF